MRSYDGAVADVTTSHPYTRVLNELVPGDGTLVADDQLVVVDKNVEPGSTCCDGMVLTLDPTTGTGTT